MVTEANRSHEEEATIQTLKKQCTLIVSLQRSTNTERGFENGPFA